MMKKVSSGGGPVNYTERWLPVIEYPMKNDGSVQAI
jgi:hypothetical protein